tara:strand:- start:800 stop:1945 length:1146 start_codon:yes stop_codon:yes gene_type:complete
MPQLKRILTLHPNHIPNYGIGHAAYSLTKSMASERLSSLIISSSIDSTLCNKGQKSYIPRYLNKIFYKLLSEKALMKATENFYLNQLQPNDIAYLWPSCSLALFKEVKDRGNTLVMESINCHQNDCKSILDKEYAKLGLDFKAQINEDNILDENTKLALCDYVFSPSPLVSKSLIKNNVPERKIIQTSYGLEKQQQFTLNTAKKAKNEPITAIFIGRVGVRKGIHLLLDYWQKAKVNGTLKIIGNVEENIQDLIAPYRDQSNIEFISFTSDLKKVYADADFFILPSLEEGSPLVTYLALGAGLPCILSPMAGEGVITHKEQGFIINPSNEDEWVLTIQQLSSSQTLRDRQSKAALTLSEQFLWENIGRQRNHALLQRLEGR